VRALAAAFIAFIGAVVVAVAGSTLGFVWSVNNRLHALQRKLVAAEGRLGARMERLDEGVGRMGERLGETQRQVHGLTGAVQSLLRLFVAGELLPAGRVLDVALTFNPVWNAEVERGRQGNPLSPEEVGRFEAYRVKLLEQRQMLTPEEVDDYQRIVARLHDERPHDQGIWLLMGLGILLEALVGVGTSVRQER
jgi:hypothetical protein